MKTIPITQKEEEALYALLHMTLKHLDMGSHEIYLKTLLTKLENTVEDLPRIPNPKFYDFKTSPSENPEPKKLVPGIFLI